MEKSSTIVSTQEEMMSTTTDDVKVLVFDAYKPKPCSSFLEAAIRALFKCFGAEKIEQVAECPATTTETPVADTPVSDDPPANPEAAPSPPVETNPESSVLVNNPFGSFAQIKESAGWNKLKGMLIIKSASSFKNHLHTKFEFHRTPSSSPIKDLTVRNGCTPIGRGLRT
ncbi:hypothetical protein D8674_025901 [Pyrus ussuriensis x Pyrus communis]|uniref:Uncharacterized protein n=1 Tax=Pyrus ussuriensis x Pyrus communis TaxID=2448454 RepID=A0A5N5I838_9ROSA|nr:hypothetical protein D8674_025901 [Pyrus ussuriensis x Pyrus communis]